MLVVAESRLRKLEADASSARDQIRKLEANASSTAAEIESMKRNLDLINFRDTHSALTRRLQWNQGDYRFCDMGQAKATPEIHASYTRESNYLAHQAPTLAFTYQGMKSIHAVMLNANKIADDWTSFVKKLFGISARSWEICIGRSRQIFSPASIDDMTGEATEVEGLLKAYLSLHIKSPSGSSVLFKPLQEIMADQGRTTHLAPFQKAFGRIERTTWVAIRYGKQSASGIFLRCGVLIVDARKDFVSIFRENLEMILSGREYIQTGARIDSLKDLVCFVGHTQGLRGYGCPGSLEECRFH